MDEYNLLTKTLLAKGYSTRHYPDYVKIPVNGGNQPALDNMQGGFVYQRDFIYKMPFMTGCGLYVMGKHCISDLHFMGEEWSYENNNPVIFCPFKRGQCEQNDISLWEGLDNGEGHCFCTCHRADVYQYEMSVERIEKEKEEEKKRLLEAYAKKKQDRICEHHMRFDEKTKTWALYYNPMRCVKEGCRGFCALRGRALSTKRGNVFYDLKVTTLRKDDTFFCGEPLIAIEKGKRLLTHPASMDICQAVAKMDPVHIWEKEWWNRYSWLHMYDPDLKIEILNVRAQAKESRDLLQDLEDIKAGISIVHESDRIAASKEVKRQQKKERFDRQKMVIEKKILDHGLLGLPAHEQVQAKKKLGDEQIAALEEKRANQPVQLSLFDL